MKSLKPFLLPRTRGRVLSWMVIMTGVIFLLSLMGVQADQRAPPPPAQGQKVKPASTVAKPAAVKTATNSTATMNKVIVTGSHIPREVKRMGRVNDTAFPLYVVDRKQIERSGAATTAEVLRKALFIR